MSTVKTDSDKRFGIEIVPADVRLAKSLTVLDFRRLPQCFGSSDRRPTRNAGLRELASRDELACGTIREGATFEVHLDLAALQVTPNQFLRQRVFNVPLDRPAQRPRAV